MDEQLDHLCYINKGKSKEIVPCPTPPGQNLVFNDPSWLDQILNAEEEELDEVLAATLSSGAAYYASTPGSSSSLDSTYPPPLPTFSTVDSSSHDNDIIIFDTPQAYSSLSSVTNPDPNVRIIKPLPKRDLKSRFPSAVRVIKPLPKQSLRSRFPGAIRITNPLPKRISKAPSFSGPETQSSVVEGTTTPSSSTYIPPSPPSNPDHDMGCSENQPDSDATMEYQPSWQQEADDYAMDDESHTRLPTSFVFQGSKDGSAKRSAGMTTYPVEEPTAYGSLFEQVDPWDTIGQILGLPNTKPSKSLGEMIDELTELDDSEEWLWIRSTIAANMTGTNDTLSTGPGQHQDSFQPDYLDMEDPSLELDDNESEPSLDSIPTTPVLQMPVHPNNFSQSPADSGMDSTSISLQPLQTLDEDSSDDESLDEVQIGDDVERDTGIHNTAVPTRFTTGRFTSTESDPNRVNSITMEDATSLTEPLRSTSMSIFELPHSAPGHGQTPSPNGQEGSTSASDPKPSESMPENNIDPPKKRRKTADFNPKRFDNTSVDTSNLLSDPAQSVPATSSEPVIIVTHCASGTRSPPIHTSLAPSSGPSGQFLSALARPRLPALPFMLQPAVPINSDVPAQTDVVLMCPAPYTDTQALDAITPTIIITPQPYTTHVLSAFDQDKPEPMPPNHVTLDTQNMDVESLAPVAEVYAQIPYEASDMDMCPDTSLGPSNFPDYHPTTAPEMWWWSDMQLDPNEDVDLEDFDDPMTSWSNLYGRSYQVHPEMTSAGDWYHAEVAEDVETGNAILAEPDRCPLVIMEDPVSYAGEEGESTTLPDNATDPLFEWSIDPSMPDIDMASEALAEAPVTTETQSPTAETPNYQTCTEVHKTQQEEEMEPVIPQPRTTKIRNVSTSMTIPPLHPELLTGDMSAFTQQISTVVNTLDSLTSLKLEAQDFGAIQTTDTQLAPATNSQPTAHGLQGPKPKTPADEPPTAERCADALDRDEFRSVEHNPGKMEAAQPEDIDVNVYPSRLCGGTDLNDPSSSIPNRGLTRHGWRPTVNNTHSTILSYNGGEMQTLDLDETAIEPMLFSDPASEGDFTRTPTVSSKTQNKGLNRSTTGISPSRTIRRLRFAVDIANTRLTFETETSAPRFESSAPSTALRVGVSSHMESIHKNSTPTTLQLDKSVKTQSFWGSFWGVITSLLWEDSTSDKFHLH